MLTPTQPSPEADKHTPRAPRAAGPAPEEGPCGMCGTVNQIGRPTCYHCKAPFTPAEMVAKLKAAKNASPKRAKKKTKKR